MCRVLLTSLLGLLVAACSGGESMSEDGEIVTPPFDVSGEAEGLLLVWFDEDGPHTASRRSDIPEAHRAEVRVEDLTIPPDEGLGADEVYVADLRSAGEHGSYTVRRMTRGSFESRVEEAAGEDAPRPSAPVAIADGDADVIIYGASWCGACRATAAFLRDRNIAFVERDIERDSGARRAMLRAANAAGVRATGIPVIDFRGTIIAGFNRAALERAISRDRSPI